MTRIGGGGGFRPTDFTAKKPSAEAKQSFAPGVSAPASVTTPQAPVSLPAGGSVRTELPSAEKLSAATTASAVESRGAPLPQGLRTPPALSAQQMQITSAIAARGAPVPAGLRQGG
jgi:hypothetical protein